MRTYIHKVWVTSFWVIEIYIHDNVVTDKLFH